MLHLLTRHYESFWGPALATRRWQRGPTHELPPDFHILEFAPRADDCARVYATCGMSQPTDARRLELHLLTSSADDAHVELLTAIAHYHRTGAPLGLGHTVNFGRPSPPALNSTTA